MLSEVTTEAVLERLGFSRRPDADADGLAAVYRAWCENVPFDNIVKRIHLASRSAAPFPNGTAEGFFASYLSHGAGGTCWPSSTGLHALLAALGFDARRGSAAMYDDRTGPIHTHGTVLVRLDGNDHWVDSSMLTRVVLPLRPGADTQIPREHETVRAEAVDDLWRVWWEELLTREPVGCLLLDDDVDEAHFLARYEVSRQMSPFNTAVFATRITPAGKVVVSAGQRNERTPAGLTTTPLGERRRAILVEEFGYSEEIVAALPPDSLAS